jgi:hypothetical protein
MTKQTAGGGNGRAISRCVRLVILAIALAALNALAMPDRAIAADGTPMRPRPLACELYGATVWPAVRAAARRAGPHSEIARRVSGSGRRHLRSFDGNECCSGSVAQEIKVEASLLVRRIPWHPEPLVLRRSCRRNGA